jgi:subtilisin family serine protease
VAKRTRVGTRRGWFSALLIALALLAASGASSSFTGSAIAADPLSKVDPQVLQDIADGQATFFAIFGEKADLDDAAAIADSNARRAYVYEQLKETADASQSGVRSDLEKMGANYTPFWIVNAIKVTGGEGLLRNLAARGGVSRIVPERTRPLPEPKPGTDEANVNVVEWGIDRINADDVWSTFGVRGEGIVVANIDTGVEYTHSAVVSQYRGNLGGGSFDHNYNWHDPSMICGSPSLAPCDNNGHGTHTMGTMVGDDGGANQIGVAPRARWMAAKGCESSSCSDSALLSSGQFVMAPTDLSGANPRPDLGANIVNNSWGGGGGDTFYQATVDAWVAAGMFPAFSNGNSGPGCGSSGSPGDFLNTYSAGAMDIGGNIAGFSSRGPSAFGGELKPNIAAPGVNVRSSVPGNGYANFSGTSMASPHLAGTVALMWSAAPSIRGDLGATRTLLDDTAADVSDLQCGGTADDNNVWGEGLLNAFAAVDQSPRGPTGTMSGTVTNSSNGNPIAGATVNVVGPSNRTAFTNASGEYSFSALPVGSYDVTASAFGFASETANGVVVTEGNNTVQSFTLDPVASHSVSGTVADSDGIPIVNGTVTILNTPIQPATTDASGNYSFPSVPEGTYDVRAEGGRCNEMSTQSLTVDGDEDLDFVLPRRHDAFGYFCTLPAFSWVEGATPLPLGGDDTATTVTLPFTFTFYGQSHSEAHVTSNGNINFLGPNATFFNSPIPSTFEPNAAIYPFWDDLYVLGDSAVKTASLGSAPNRMFVIEWENVAFFADFSRRVDFEIVLHENGQILTQYQNIADDGRERGNDATIGIENHDGTDALQYSFGEAVLSGSSKFSVNAPTFAILYQLPPNGFFEGTVTDANDGLALGGATVKVIQGGTEIRTLTTDEDGFYRTQVPLGTYTIEASKTNYGTQSRTSTLDEDGETVVENFALQTPRAVVNPTSLQFIATPNSTKTKRLVVRNTGSLPMTWEIRETGGGQVSAESTARPEKNPNADPNARTTQNLYKDGTPAGWAPTAPGDVLASWPTVGLTLPWGVGYDGDVWISDPLAGGDLCAFLSSCHNIEYGTDGTPTGGDIPADWAGAWNGDMAYDSGRNLLCQVNVGGDNGIYCMDPATGTVVDSITSGPWTGISQRGLAYRPDDDSFYIGGWNEGILYHVKGLSHPDKGAVISQCNPPDFNISGLAWNPAFNVVWQATNSPTDTIYQLNPDTCTVLSTLPHPTPGFNGAGIEMDEAGNLWTVSQNFGTAYLIESGVPAFTDVPWLSESPASGTVPVNGTQNIDVTVNTTGMSPGVYGATLFIVTNSGRVSTLRVPVTLIVPAYRQGVNAAGGAYNDLAEGDPWAADQAYSSGSWGYVGRGNTSSTRRAIAGTLDDPLYQNERSGMGEYRFDGLPNGVYQVELLFSENSNRRVGQHLFDVLAESQVLLFAHDIVLSAGGTYRADNHSFFLPVTDGSLDVRFIERRSFGQPQINALRVTHRPDR